MLPSSCFDDEHVLPGRAGLLRVAIKPPLVALVQPIDCVGED